MVQKPALCLVLTNDTTPDTAIYPDETTWLELRLDLFTRQPSPIVDIAKHPWLKTLLCNYSKIIITYRSLSNNSNSILLAEQCYRNCLSSDTIPFVDIDYHELFTAKLLAEFAPEHNRIILSEHFYSYNGDLELIRNTIRKLQQHQPYLCKVAVLCHDAHEAVQLLTLYEEFDHLLLFAMGEIGSFTRIAAPLLGAPYTYTSYTSDAVAPGMLPAHLMQQIYTQNEE